MQEKELNVLVRTALKHLELPTQDEIFTALKELILFDIKDHGFCFLYDGNPLYCSFIKKFHLSPKGKFSIGVYHARYAPPGENSYIVLDNLTPLVQI